MACLLHGDPFKRPLKLHATFTVGYPAQLIAIACTFGPLRHCGLSL